MHEQNPARVHKIVRAVEHRLTFFDEFAVPVPIYFGLTKILIGLKNIEGRKVINLTALPNETDLELLADLPLAQQEIQNFLDQK